MLVKYFHTYKINTYIYNMLDFVSITALSGNIIHKQCMKTSYLISNRIYFSLKPNIFKFKS